MRTTRKDPLLRDSRLERVLSLAVANSSPVGTVFGAFSSPTGLWEEATEWSFHRTLSRWVKVPDRYFLGFFMSAHLSFADRLGAELRELVPSQNKRKNHLNADPLVVEVAKYINALDEWAYPFLRKRSGGHLSLCAPEERHYTWAKASAVRVSDYAEMMREAARRYGHPLPTPMSVVDFDLHKSREKVLKKICEEESKEDIASYPMRVLGRLPKKLYLDEVLRCAKKLCAAVGPQPRSHEELAEEVGGDAAVVFFLLLHWAHRGRLCLHPLFGFSTVEGRPPYEDEEELEECFLQDISFLSSDHRHAVLPYDFLVGEPETLRWQVLVTAHQLAKKFSVRSRLCRHWSRDEIVKEFDKAQRRGAIVQEDGVLKTLGLPT